MRVKTILSDAGDILFTSRRYTKDLFYEFVKEKLPPEIFTREKIAEIFKRHRHHAFVDKKYSYEQSCQQALQEVGLEHGVKEFLSYQDSFPIQFHAGVNETIRSVQQQGFHFYLVSDADKTEAEYQQFLQERGVGGVEGIVTSKDVGYTKPSRQFFDQALQKYALKLNECAFLGHDYDELEGAHAYGFPVIIACNYDPADDLHFIPDNFKIQKFKDLPAVLKFPG